MSGTKKGGMKAAQTFASRYGPEHRRKNGSIGGKIGGGKGGFKNNPELARRAGRIGGSRSRSNNQGVENAI